MTRHAIIDALALARLEVAQAALDLAVQVVEEARRLVVLLAQPGGRLGAHDVEGGAVVREGAADEDAHPLQLHRHQLHRADAALLDGVLELLEAVQSLTNNIGGYFSERLRKNAMPKGTAAIDNAETIESNLKEQVAGDDSE